jgi:hypothetical protein
MEKREILEAEMKLAKMIAAAKSRGLSHCTGANFRDKLGLKCVGYGDVVVPPDAVSCCAVGAQILAGVFDDESDSDVMSGNDNYLQSAAPGDHYLGSIDYTVGYAFALAMQEDDALCQT